MIGKLKTIVVIASLCGAINTIVTRTYVRTELLYVCSTFWSSLNLCRITHKYALTNTKIKHYNQKVQK